MSLVIIKANYFMKPKEYDEIYKAFCKEKEQGVILVPLGFEATYVPDDVEIKMEEKN